MFLRPLRSFSTTRRLNDMHNFGHHFNTVFKKDPAVERWMYQRYYGQFGQFKVNAWNLKWLVILYGAFPAYLFYTNEYIGAKLDDCRIESGGPRLGRVSLE